MYCFSSACIWRAHDNLTCAACKRVPAAAGKRDWYAQIRVWLDKDREKQH